VLKQQATGIAILTLKIQKATNPHSIVIILSNKTERFPTTTKSTEKDNTFQYIARHPFNTANGLGMSIHLKSSTR